MSNTNGFFDGIGMVDAPATRAFAVTTSDTVNFEFTTRGLWTGTGGTIVLVPMGQSNAVTFASVPPGVVLPIRVKRVNATNTTATGLIGLY